MAFIILLNHTYIDTDLGVSNLIVHTINADRAKGCMEA